MHYHEDLPIQVNAHGLPLRKMAPCWADGRVNTVDFDTKDAIYECKYMICLVDQRNIIEKATRK